MKELNFDTGIVTYNINGRFQLQLNPTDNLFIEKVYSAFEMLDKEQDGYKAEIERANTKEIFEIARKRDSEMRKQIDYLLGDGASEAIFGDMSVYALADGLPLWANLMLALVDEMDANFTGAQQRSNTRIDKYLKKYKR